MNSLSKSDLQSLREIIQQQCRGASAVDVEDVVQTAIVRALEQCGASSSTSEQLLALAKKAVPGVQGKRLEALRRGGSVAKVAAANESSNAPCLEPQRRQRPPRVPHTPKGVIPVGYSESGTGGVDYARQSVAELPTEVDKATAERIMREVIDPILRGEPVPPDTLRSLGVFYGQCFESGPLDEWADVFLRELELAARLRLAKQGELSMRAAASFGATVLPRQDGGLHLVANMQERLPDGTLGRAFDVLCEGEVVASSGHETMVALFGEVRGAWQLIGWVWLVENEATLCDEAADGPLATLARAKERISRLAHCRPIPTWFEDVDVLEWLILRTGFDGGGGRSKVSSSRILEWLKSPQILASEIEKYGVRWADRCNDEQADIMLARHRDMASRVRSAAGIDYGETVTPG